jgi:hypothetical protein
VGRARGGGGTARGPQVGVEARPIESTGHGRTIHQTVRDAYEAIAYVGRPFHETHRTGCSPSRSCTAAPPNGDDLGAEMRRRREPVPMAASYPRGRFVGVDLSGA